MPLYKKIKSPEGGMLGIWKIEESSDELLAMSTLSMEDQEKITNFTLESRKQEWLASRLLIHTLTNQTPQINYLENGKPILNHGTTHLSISHTKGWACVALSSDRTCGVDIEYPSIRVQKVSDRFVGMEEERFITKHQALNFQTLIWCTKEALYKIISKKEVDFKQNLFVEPFELSTTGKIKARWEQAEQMKSFTFDYLVTDDFYLVYHL